MAREMKVPAAPHMTHELLEEHNAAANGKALGGGPCRYESDMLSSEEAKALLAWEPLSGHGLVKKNLSLDGQILRSKRACVRMDLTKLSQGGQTLFLLAAHKVETRRLGKENHANTQNKRRDDLECERNPPGSLRLSCTTGGSYIVSRVESWFVRSAARVRNIGCASMATDVLSSVLKPVAHQNTQGDAELLQNNEGATIPTARPATARPKREVVGKWTIDERSKPGAEKQRRYEPTLETAIKEDAREVGRKRLHGQNSRDHTLIVAEEEAA
ncbi:hypothetical protein HG530_007963 [Fusarium avenaceum]|nr:hypothetical protein HG530_007963 [Fusarium avenaceum]